MNSEGTVVLALVSSLIGSTPQAPQVQSTQSPSEKILIRSTRFEWSELLRIQASLPPTIGESEEPAQDVIELPSLALQIVDEHSTSVPLYRSQKLLPLPCEGFIYEPDISAGFASQADQPDTGGTHHVPPDVAGSVGPEHLMTMLNNKVLIQDRLGGSLSSLDLPTFWSPLAASATTYPRCYYDTLSARWIATVRSGAGGAMSIGFALSQTSDPTGSWDFYSIPADPSGTTFPDWIPVGYNSTWIVITANMFDVSGGTPVASKMWVIDKSTALTGGPITVSTFPTGFMTTVHGVGMAGTSPHPSRAFDASDSCLWLVNNSFFNGSTGDNLLQVTRICGTGAAPIVSGLSGSPFSGTSSLCFVDTNYSKTQRPMEQLGEIRLINAYDTRVASVALRNGKIWVVHSGGLPGPATNTSPTSNGVLWHELDPELPFPPAPGTPGSMLVQSGAITNGVDTMSMYPSLAVNCANDVIVGFSSGDASIYPRASYAIRLGIDPPNTMGPIRELKAGESTYWKNFGTGLQAPWGRYTSCSVDPLDDEGLCTLQQYAGTRVDSSDAGSRWGTFWSCCHQDIQTICGEGTEFIMAWTPLDLVPTGSPVLILSSNTSCNVTVHYPLNAPFSLNTTVAVTPGIAQFVVLPVGASQDWNTNALGNNCVHASSSIEFKAVMLASEPAASDAALALPVSDFNTEYVVSGYEQSGEFVVVAAEDSTSVTITPTENLTDGHLSGVPFTITLNRGDGYYAGTALVSNNLIGTTLSADKPIGLTNGNSRGIVPAGWCCANHIFEVAQPVQAWGLKVLATNPPNRPSCIYRIVAARDATTLTMDGAVVAVLDHSDFYDTGNLLGSHVFEANLPIWVTQYMAGASTLGGFSSLGDPAMVNLVPIGQYRPDNEFTALWNAPPLNPTNFLTLYVDDQDVSSLTLDGTPVGSSNFAPIPASGYSVARLPISFGVHRTSSAHPHWATVQGYSNSWDAYMYPVGGCMPPPSGKKETILRRRL